MLLPRTARFLVLFFIFYLFSALRCYDTTSKPCQEESREKDNQWSPRHRARMLTLGLCPER
ncbi:hypothetical protein BDV09DRAFT_163028 [Aspergillus tetrazonus]